MKMSNLVRLLMVAAPVMLIAACSDDPTSEGSGDAFAIVTNVSEGVRSLNTGFTLTGAVVDRQGTRLPTELSVTSVNTGSVAIDSTRFVLELQETRVYARAIGASAGAPIVFSAASLADTVTIIVQ
jgi:hypothetical protein